MKLMTTFQRAQLSAQARVGGIAVTFWPLIFRASAYRAGNIQLPPAADRLYLAEVGGPPSKEAWLTGVFLHLGDPREPTRARFEALQLAKEIMTCHYAWLYQSHLEGPRGHDRITHQRSWLQHLSWAAGVSTNRWYTTTT